MSEQYPGGFITKEPPTPQGNTAVSSAYGIWNLSQQAAYQAQGLWPDPANTLDAQFNYVTMLLHGDGTNGAQNNTFLDSSTNNFTITRNGNPTQGSFSPYGSNWSNYFATSYLSISSTAADITGGAFTVECWAMRTATSGAYTQWIVGKRSTSGADSYVVSWYLGVNSSGQLAFVGSGVTPSNVTSPNTMAVGQWYHVAAVSDGTNVKLYENGVLVAGPTALPITNYGYSGTIGNYPIDNPYYTGYISNLRIVKGSQVYTSNFTPSTSPLTAISGTSLLTCQSNRFIDNSTNNYAITLTGTPSVQRFNPFGTSTAYSTATIGGSGYFDGNTDALTVNGMSSSVSDFCLEMWFYSTVDLASGTRVVCGEWGGASGNLSLIRFSGGNFEVNLANTSVLNVGASTHNFNSYGWQYLAITRSGSTLRLFANGVEVASATFATSVNFSKLNIAGERFGAFNTECWAGYLTDSRVVIGSAVYTSSFTPPTAPLTAISNTQLLLNYTNGAIYDNAMMNDLETVGNAQISTSVKKYGTGSLAFDGTGETCAVAHNPWMNLGSGNWTIEFWVYANSTSRADVVSKGNASTYVPYLIQLQSGYINLYFSDNGIGYSFTLSSSAGAYTTGNWVHVAVVRNGSTMTIYANGTSVGSNTYSGTLYAGNTQPLGIGGDSSGSYVINGYMDDVRITNGYARYTSTFTPPTAAFPNIGPT